MTEITERVVDSSGVVRIAVYEEGNPDGPTLVMVHGWPDSHVVWDGVVPVLADRFRIIRYDNRGVGKTSVPKAVSAYTMSCYADDFAAVIDAVAPGEPVHVLAHDWGSVGMWEYLARPGASDRVASFTSVSGPSADHLNRYIIGSLKRPYRPKSIPSRAEPVPFLLVHGIFLHPRGGAACSARFHRRGFASHAEGAGRNPFGEAAPFGHL